MTPNFVVAYSTDFGATWTDLANVQQINIEHGRRRQLDAVQGSRCTVVARYPNGFASPLTGIVPENVLRVVNGTQLLFMGRIADVEISYGIPYANNVGPADFLTISVEGNFARAARTGANAYSMAGGTVTQQLNAMNTQATVPASYGTSGSDPVLAATTVNGNWGDWINQVLVTVNGRMYDGYDPVNLTLVSPYQRRTIGFGFSDTANNSTNQVYDRIDFGSWADNYYTQVTVDPESFAPQTATASGASAPFRTLTTNTLNSSTGQALDNANYLLNNYSTRAAKIVSISCLAEAQNSFQLDKCGGVVAYGPGAAPGVRTTVTFRGTTIQAVIEGVTISIVPGSARFTFYLSGADLNSYLVLDDTVYGKLDENKLGW